MKQAEWNRLSRYSRRDFGRIVLAGVPFSVAWARASSVGGVRIGVQSYSFRTMSLDEAIQAMADIGIGECELFSGHVEPRPAGPTAGGTGAPQTPPFRASTRRGPDPAAREELRKWRLTVSLDHFREVRAKFEQADIRLQSYNLSFNDAFTDEEIDRGFQMAQALGVDFMTASGTVSSAKRVAVFADKYKLRVAMHNHDRVDDPNEFATPESFATAMAYSPYIAVNLDVGHFFAAGYDPIAYIESHHERIANLHLKDRNRNTPQARGANLPWGEGITPIKEVLQLLKTKGYDIPANIEYEYRGEDPVVEVRKCLEYCKRALEA